MTRIIDLTYARAKRRAQEAANETFNDCLMYQLQEGKVAEDFDDFGFYRPSISDAELKAELGSVIAEGSMSPAGYLDCVRAAAEEANYIYDVVLADELSRRRRSA
jgi:hypothetical protein